VSAAETATRVFEELTNAPERAENRYDPAQLYDTLEREGLLRAWPDEAPGETADVLRLSGRYAPPVPIAETCLARWLLSSAGLPAPDGWLAVAPVRPADRMSLRRGGDGRRLSGTLRGVPHARSATRLVLAESGERAVVVLDPADRGLAPARDLSGEPRDDVRLESVAVPDDCVATSGVGGEALLLAGALARALQMAGAMERVLELSVAHARGREQFGRPIGKFQAVQHHLAVLAGEVAAASTAAEAAVLALVGAGGVEGAAFEIASAKLRAGEATGEVAAVAHQVHGAVGFTERHPLRHYTTSLWTWRDEFGSESEWASRLGGAIAAGGAERLWPTLTGTAKG